MGRHNLASGVSHWFGFQKAQAPEGRHIQAADHRKCLPSKLELLSEFAAIERYAAPQGIGV
jgi:hypothetical protein